MTLPAKAVNELKKAPQVEGVLPILLNRWSPRAFSSRPVEAAHLARLFEAARWAPSSYNEQPWRYIVGLKGTPTYDKIAAALIGFNQAWASKAPVLILGLGKTTFSHNGTPDYYSLYDLGAATVLLALQAEVLGLATHQMGGFDQEVIRAEFAIPDEYAIGSVLALGYQDEPATLPNEHMIAQEITPRSRKPLNELVFSSWGQPLQF